MKAEIKPRITLEGRTRLETVIPLSTPYLVFLDPSDKCNQQCRFCPSGDRELLKKVGRVPQLIDLRLYKKIINDLSVMPEKIRTLRLYADGEPLLHPHLPEMISYAKQTGRFGQIDLTSNGTLLTKRIIQGIVDAGLDKIFISVPETYSVRYLFRLGGLYNYSRGKCKIHAKFIGEEDNEKFYEDFSDISDYMSIENRINCWPNFDAGDNPDVGIYGNPLTNIKVCPYPLYSLKINSDGTVSVCFIDWPHKMIVGDLGNESFYDIWNGKKLRNFRVMQLKGLRGLHPFCGNCHQLTHGMPDNVDNFAKEILEKI